MSVSALPACKLCIWQPAAGVMLATTSYLDVVVNHRDLSYYVIVRYSCILLSLHAVILGCILLFFSSLLCWYNSVMPGHTDECLNAYLKVTATQNAKHFLYECLYHCTHVRTTSVSLTQYFYRLTCEHCIHSCEHYPQL